MTSILLTLDKVLAFLLRKVMKGKISRKRVSQEFFRCLAQKYAASGVQHWTPVSGSKEEILSFLQADTRVVFVGGSDYTFCSLTVLEMFPNVLWFVQNLNVQASSRVRPLPIGVEGLQWGRAGMPWHFELGHRLRPKSDRCLVGPFRETHLDRKRLLGLESSGQLKVIDRQLASFHYSYLASTYRWVACPEGNGVDTHRFWETLERGSIPVVVRNAWSKNMESLQIPMLQIDSWENLEEQLIASTAEVHLSSQGKRLNLLEQNYWEDTLLRVLSA